MATGSGFWRELSEDLLWGFRRIRVYALVGKAGTGKSFRARIMAERMGIELIIDDGLLVRGDRILAGQSAKKAANRPAATKCSILMDRAHMLSVRRALRKERFGSILILGISEKMVERIVDRLQLPRPHGVTRIEDIASREEIAKALKSRHVFGRHVIPVPMVEVRKDPGSWLLAPIRLLAARRKTARPVEQTIVHPAFGRGSLAITEAALTQMIQHCVREIDKEVVISKIRIDYASEALKVEVALHFNIGTELPERLAMLQRFTKRNIEHFTGVSLDQFNLVLDGFQNRRSALPDLPARMGRDDSEPMARMIRAAFSFLIP